MSLSRRTLLGSSLSTLTVALLAPMSGSAQDATPEVAGGSDWPMYRGGPTHVGATSAPAPKGSLSPLWVFASGAKNASNPVVAGDTLFVSGDDDIVWAIDRLTGAQRWAVAVGPGAYDTGGHSVPAVVDGMVFVGASSGAVFALDPATGDERWRFATRDVAISPPLVANGVLYIGSNDGFVYALDSATGAVRWQRETGPIYISSATLGDDNLYIGAADGTFYCLAIADGTVQWTARTGRKMKTAAFQNGIVFAPSYDGRVYAFDAKTGAQRWATPDIGGLAEANNPAVLGDTVVATIDDHGIFAFDTATGAERWARSDVEGGYSSPVIAGDVVYVSVAGTDLATFDLATGKTLATFPLGFYAGAPAIANETLYIVADNGNAYAFTSASVDSATPIPLPSPMPGTKPTSSPLSQLPATNLPSAGTFVQAITTTSGPSDSLKGPEGIAFGADGRMYLVDSLNDRLVVYNPDGTFSQTIGKTGTGDGEFGFSTEDKTGFAGDIVTGPDGSLYVCDFFNGRVQQFGADGTHRKTVGLGEGALAGGAVVDASTNRLYVSDLASSHVFVFDLALTLQGTLGPTASPFVFATPFGLGLATDGSILVCEYEDGRVTRVNADGTEAGSIGQYGIADGRFRSPTDVVQDAKGNTYVSDYSAAHIQVFKSDGTPLAMIGSPGTGDGQFGNPTYLAFGPDGLLYVSDDTANRVLVFSVALP